MTKLTPWSCSHIYLIKSGTAEISHSLDKGWQQFGVLWVLFYPESFAIYQYKYWCESQKYFDSPHAAGVVFVFSYSICSGHWYNWYNKSHWYQPHRIKIELFLLNLFSAPNLCNFPLVNTYLHSRQSPIKFPSLENGICLLMLQFTITIYIQCS